MNDIKKKKNEEAYLKMPYKNLELDFLSQHTKKLLSFWKLKMKEIE
jgi:hypothetical protein